MKVCPGLSNSGRENTRKWFRLTNGLMRLSKFRFLVLAGMVAVFGVNGSFAAAPYKVTNNHDSGSGSLRAAILNANVCGGKILISHKVKGRIELLSALPSLAANITILGPGEKVLTVSGAKKWRILSMNPGTTNRVFGLTLADGMDAGYHDAFTFASGISNAGSLVLLDCVVSNCSSFQSYGVGIYNSGQLSMKRCRVTDCYDYSGLQTVGGGVYNGGRLEIKNCKISHCTGGGNGGGAGGIYNAGTLLMTGSLVNDCDGDFLGDGGGILNEAEATLNTCVVSNCSGWYAGGIKNFGNLWLTNCSVLNNDAEDGSGVLSFGNAVLSGCTVAGNVGHFLGGSIDNLGAMQLYNCTVSRNVMVTAPFLASFGSGISDGIFEGGSGSTSLYLEHCTVVSNSGPVQIWTINTLTANRSILGDCSGAMSSAAAHNLIIATNDCALAGSTDGNFYCVDPRLGPLQNNGGPTWTHALLPGSPAINAGGAADGTPRDQRGVARPQGTASDIGAYEFAEAFPKLVRMTVHPRVNSCLQWSGSPGCACIVQASTNCVSWLNLTNLCVGANGLMEFTDADAGKYPSRFYRLMLPAPPRSP